MDMTEDTNTEEQAVFNMALDTLKRLGKNLEEQKALSYKPEYPIAILQKIKIGLVKQFFVQASPLLPADVVKKYKDEILSITPKTRTSWSKGSMCADKFNGTDIIYDEGLEIRLDEIIIELQMILQKEKYFMPSADDEGDF